MSDNVVKFPLFTRAVMVAARDVINGALRPITTEEIIERMSGVPASVVLDVLAKFKKAREAREGGQAA